MGNLRSVEKGFLKVGVDVKVTSNPLDVEDASAVVLPGVGAFRDCMRNLDDLDLLNAVLKSIERGKPYLGICLGLQILFSESTEFGHCRGLDVIKGKVVRFPGMGLKIPHMGWNTVSLRKRPPVFNDEIGDESYFYFVHSYYVVPDSSEYVSGTTTYGIEFTSMVWKDNIIATQFHPEKSQKLGLRVLRGFAEFASRA